MFYEILTAEIAAVNDSIDSLVTELRWIALDQYKYTLESMVTDSLILKENNSSSFEPVVQEYVDVLMHLTDSVKIEANYKQQFNLELNKLALMRLLGKHEQALHIATNLSYCEHDSLQQFVLEELKERISSTLISKQQGFMSFLSDSSDTFFEIDSSIFEIPAESFIDSSGFGTYINGPSNLVFSSCAPAFGSNKALNGSGYAKNVAVFPNPATDEITVKVNNEIADKKSLYTFELYTLSGNQVLTSQISSRPRIIDVSRIASGIYIYRVTSADDNFFEEGKLVISK